MIYDWIQSAMENGGIMTASESDGKARASMYWIGEETISGDFCDTLPEAITSLNSALHDDAANEMIESGAV